MPTVDISDGPGDREKPLKDTRQCGSRLLAVDTINIGKGADI
jgi:hypothetical protein